MGLVHFLRFGLVVYFLLFASVVAADESYSIRINDQTEVNVQKYPAGGDTAVLWFPSEAGLIIQDMQTAKRLAANGYEVHIVDMIDAYLLPNLRSSMLKIPAEAVAAVIDQISKTKSKLVIITVGRGVVPTLRGLRLWQQSSKRKQRKKLLGVVVLSPNLYIKTPEPGKDADYLKVTDKTRTRVYILQPMLSPWFWWRQRLEKRLYKAGSRVTIKTLRGVRDRFYYRPDANDRERQMAKQLPDLLIKAIKALPEMKK